MSLTAKRRARAEKGQVLVLVVIFMLMGALMIAPLLSFMGTGLKAGTQNETRMNQLYAADAGFEDAINRIKVKTIGDNITFPNSPGQSARYDPGVTLNGRPVYPVSIAYVDNTTFRVVSVALDANGEGTVVKSFVKVANFYNNLLMNAITSPGTITMQNNEIVNGTIQSPQPPFVPNPGSLSGNYTLNPSAPTWPPYSGLGDYYLNQVMSVPHTEYQGNTNLTAAQASTGPIYVNGNLEIDGPGTATLGGTIYVTGGLSFKNNPDLVLGNSANVSNTIYVYGEGYPPEATAVSSSSMAIDSVTLYGPGALIARQGIYYHPNVPAANPGFIFVLSTNGEVNFQPQANTVFYGSIAGATGVIFQSNVTVNWVQPPFYLNVPGMGSTNNVVQSIFSYYIDIHMPVIINGGLPAGDQGFHYAESLMAAGGTTPYHWSITSSSPGGDWLKLTNSENGTIEGDPGVVGTYVYAVHVADSAGEFDDATLSVTINPAPAITTQTLPNGVVGTTYNATVKGDNGTLPYSWTWSPVSATLPPGLTLNPVGGTITGMPTTAGTYQFTVTLTDAAHGTAMKSFTISFGATTLVITTLSLPDGKVGTPYSQTLAATGGTPPYVLWSIASGSLAGSELTLSLDGTISGTPPASAQNNTYSFTVQVVDSVGTTATKAFSIKIKP